MPLSETCCGLVGSEFVTRKVAVRVPPAVGVKVTLIVQPAPAAKVEPQVVVRAKSPAFVPVKEVTIEVRLVVPMLLRVTTWAELVVPATWSLKVKPVGLRVTPVPVCGLPEALSVMESEAVREPIALGLNVMLKVQLSPTARVAPQVVVRVKSAALVPVTLVLLMVILAVPVLVSVTVLALLVVLSP